MTTDFADVTVIMPAYRAASTIGRALSSIASQTLKPRAVVVVDDGSDDSTLDAAEVCRDKLIGVELLLLRQDNAGPGAARNRALANATTKYVAFLDADDEWLPEKLARAMPKFDDDSVALVSHNYIQANDGVETTIDCTRHFNRGASPYLSLFLRNFIATSTVVAQREAVQSHGGFDESLLSAQDYQLWLSIAAKHGVRFDTFPEALARCHVTPGSVSSNIARRRECAVKILEGQLGPLRRRARFPLTDALWRTVLIAVETARMHRIANHPVAAWAEFPRLLIDLPRIAIKLAGTRSNLLTDSRDDVTEENSDPLARNRQWWERMPMTYADWQGDERMPQATSDFESIRTLVFANSPFFRESFDMTKLKGKQVLDLGCGSGVFSCLLSEAGADVTAVDLTEAAVKLTRDSSKIFGCPVRVTQMNAESLGINDASFDYVFSWGVLHHTPTPRRAYGEVARILKPGGSGIIMVYHKTSIIYYVLGLYWLIARGKLFRGYTLEKVQGFFTDGFYHRNYTRRAFVEELRLSGLTVTDLIVTQMEKKILPFIPARLDRYLKARFGWLLVAHVAKPGAAVTGEQPQESRLSTSSI